MQQEQHQLDLSHILHQQIAFPNKDFFVHALSLSRIQCPKVESLPFLRQLIAQNEKWIEVGSRICSLERSGFNMIAEAFINDFAMYRVFVEMAFKHKETGIINKIAGQTFQRMKVEIEIDISQKVLFQTFQMILIHGKNEDVNFFVPFFSNEPSIFIDRHLSSNSAVIDCIVILIEKFLELEKKNLFSTQFQSNYTQFNNLIRKIFLLSLDHHSPKTFEILSTLTKKTSFYPLYLEHGNKLLSNCEKYFVAFNKQMNQIYNQNYEQVVNYEDDVIKDQNSKTIESESGKLLQSLVCNIDGMLVSLFDRILENLKFIFQENNMEKNKQLIELYYLELLISAKSLEQTDLLQRLTEFLGDYSEHIFILSPSAPIVNLRVIKIIEKFIKVLPSNLIEETVSFLFKVIEEQPMNGLVFRVYNTLRTFINKKQLYVIMNPCIIEISSRVLILIEKAPTHHYFQILDDCLRNFKQLAKRSCVQFLKYFTARIHVQILKCNSQNKRINEIINCIYDCIKTLFSISGLLDDQYEDVEPLLNQHAFYLEHPNRIDFQDRILYLAAVVVNKGKVLTPFVMMCLKSVMGIYNKHKDLDCLFELFYGLCSSATDQMLEKYESVQFMIDLVLRYFRQEVHESILCTHQFQKACVILQLIIQYCQPLFLKGELRQKILTQLSNTQTRIKIIPSVQFVNIYLSLHFISPFNIELPRECLELTTLYSDKLRVLYLVGKVKFGFQNSFENLLDYLSKYLSNYLMKLEEESQQNYYQDKFLQHIRFPFQSIDEIIQAQELFKEFTKSKKIDVVELSEDQRNTIATLMKVEWCGKQLRKVHKFLHIE